MSAYSESPQPHSHLAESWVFAGRLFVQWRRYPMVPIQALLFPTLLLVTYSLLVGGSMIRITGSSGLDVLIPVCALAGAMSGAVGAGMVLPHDRESGLLTRLWIQPVHRASAISGILLAEALRTLVGTVVIFAAGIALGFRFDGGLLALIVYLLIPAAVVVVFATVVITVALNPQGRTILAWVATVCMGLAFATIVPPERIPALLLPITEYQPIAPVVRLMRALSMGGDALWQPLLLATAWTVLLAFVFGPLAVRGYRRAAETGKVDG